MFSLEKKRKIWYTKYKENYNKQAWRYNKYYITSCYNKENDMLIK